MSEQILLARLAELTRPSVFHFSRAFEQSFGMPPHRYHISRRIERAKPRLAQPGPDDIRGRPRNRIQRDELVLSRLPPIGGTFPDGISAERRMREDPT